MAARRTAPLLALQAEYPTQVVFAAIDINDPEAATQLLQLAEVLGGIDVYLHSSGAGHENKELNPDIELDIVQTNGSGFIRMVTAAFRYWTSRGQRGHLAAITSVAGTRGLGISPAYSATKRMQSQYHRHRAGFRTHRLHRQTQLPHGDFSREDRTPHRQRHSASSSPHRHRLALSLTHHFVVCPPSLHLGAFTLPLSPCSQLLRT